MTGDQIAFVGMVMMVIIAAVLVVGLIHGWKHH
jgi:hypothetical protein